uniref:Vacuolar protein-sorting-associated protein 36 n=1 Tax=Chromera velia CCMP2878 TaxID=1169474 RepID=A0A0G4GHX1_9ALVE|eukprot:Cvel_4733.t1-p1 / transcript=Cvel_4733.t1 / gene=Cvel_4733 / organism=Chromera_velia_CCMP2878 / gene_product=Vacuolar protein-sorting-associated protein 36, putative / transcript_product=Vacuolar protein-sorting-associated protein 36, putative / location=Cvel_scaffold210:79445-80860(+) / protein_length=472 / sequence_SO=supercontig / SO=protein_coding / is_pseudo=false
MPIESVSAVDEQLKEPHPYRGEAEAWRTSAVRVKPAPDGEYANAKNLRVSSHRVYWQMAETEELCWQEMRLDQLGSVSLKRNWFSNPKAVLTESNKQVHSLRFESEQELTDFLRHAQASLGARGWTAGGFEVQRRVGLDRVLRMNANRMENQKETVSDALGDLESLRQNAEQMAVVARRIARETEESAKAEAGGGKTERERDEMRALLVQFGLANPQVLSMSSASRELAVGEAAYLDQLSSEVAAFARRLLSGNTAAGPSAASEVKSEKRGSQGGSETGAAQGEGEMCAEGEGEKEKAEEKKKWGEVEGSGSAGVILLHDLYCLFNRARGTDLISPEDLRAAVDKFEDSQSNAGLRLRKMRGGALAVQLESFDDAAVSRALQRLISEQEEQQKAAAKEGEEGGSEIEQTSACMGVTAMQLASLWKVSLPLAQLMLLEAEAGGSLCRDDSISGLYFFPNRFGSFKTNNGSVSA